MLTGLNHAYFAILLAGLQRLSMRVINIIPAIQKKIFTYEYQS